MTETNTEFRQLVRIANVDLDGNKAIYFALKKIDGVSFSFSNAICNLVMLDKFRKAGTLTAKEVENIEKVLADPKKHNIPVWLFNRRFDVETGEDRHLLGGDRKFAIQSDIRKLQKIKSYKGFRHQWKLPVRGQRTRGNFRRGTTIGVSKKKATSASAAAATAADKKKEKKK